jgi:hypothetical protein
MKIERRKESSTWIERKGSCHFAFSVVFVLHGRTFAARERAGGFGTKIQARHCRLFFDSASFTRFVVIYFYMCIGEVSLEERIGRKEKYTERNTYIQNQTATLKGMAATKKKKDCNFRCSATISREK